MLPSYQSNLFNVLLAAAACWLWLSGQQLCPEGPRFVRMQTRRVWPCQSMPNCLQILKPSFDTLASFWFCAGDHKQQPPLRQGFQHRLPTRNRSRCGPAAGTDCEPLPLPAGSLGTKGGLEEVPGNVCQRCKRVSASLFNYLTEWPCRFGHCLLLSDHTPQLPLPPHAP